MKKWNIVLNSTHVTPPMAVTCTGNNGTLSSVTEGRVITPPTEVNGTWMTSIADQTTHKAQNEKQAA
jgi:hypothetical protein